MTVVQNVTVLDALALVQLRSLLDEARRASQRVSPVTRLFAVVLLDAVNENAMNLVASSLGVTFAHRENFDGLKSKLQSELGTSWTIVRNTWRDVHKLHQARNLAQHHGIGADKDEIAGWRSATAVFADSLIQVVFGIALDDARFSDAIEDPGLRELLLHAEDYLEDGRLTDSIKATYDAFRSVSDRWQRLSEDRRSKFKSRPFHSDIFDRKSFDYLESLAKFGADMVAHQVFSTSPSEYIWFKHIMDDPPESLGEDEVRRALTFVSWWIVEWQSVAPDFVEDRRRRAQKARRRVRAQKGPARVLKVEVKELSWGTDDVETTDQRGTWRVFMPLVDVPDEVDFSTWRRELETLVRSLPGVQYSMVDEAGVLRIDIVVRESTAFTPLVGGVRESLAAAEDRAEAARKRAKALSDQRQHEKNSFMNELNPRRKDLPWWVADVTLGVGEGFGNSDCVFVHTNIDILRSGNAVRQAIESNSAIESAIPRVGTYMINPCVSVDVLMDVLAGATPAVEADLEARAGNEARREERRRIVREQFARLIQDE